jgi:2-haloalkanoic acid dehalogenase type II
MPRHEAVVFDLLTALLDSWSLWNAVAGSSAGRGFAWRQAYLRRAYAAGVYQPYEALLFNSARDAGVPASCAAELLRRWDLLEPWPDVAEVLGQLSRVVPLALVTNCSAALGARAAARVPVRFSVVVTAERAGYYKPDPHPYRLALTELRTAPERTLFVAGSPGDVSGAAAVGMKVFWHDRVGLDLPEGAPRPLAKAASLRPLLAEVLG